VTKKILLDAMNADLVAEYINWSKLTPTKSAYISKLGVHTFTEFSWNWLHASVRASTVTKKILLGMIECCHLWFWLLSTSD